VRNAPQCYPSPDGSDDKRVFVSGARLEKLTKVLRLGLQPPEVLQLLLAFDLFDEEWDVANTIRISFIVNFAVIKLIKDLLNLDTVFGILNIMLTITIITIAGAGEVAVLIASCHPFQYVKIIIN
jgi:hypothetical protein